MQMQMMECSKMGRVALRWALCLTLALTAAAISTAALAQNSSSAVTGVITDAKGAVVVSAKILLHNVDTNVERETVSNSSGNYFFNSIPPARYTLKIVAPSFQAEII